MLKKVEKQRKNIEKNLDVERMLKKMSYHIMMTLKTEYQDKQGHKKLEWDHQEGQTNFKDRT